MCWSGSASLTPATVSSGRTRAVRAAGSTSAQAWSGGRSCCCSTSPPPASTPAAASLWDAIRGLVADGTDVLLTTQYLEEADQLARHVVIIDHGRAIAAGTPDELKNRAGTNVIEVRPRVGGDLAAVEAALGTIGCETPHTDMDTQRVSARVEGGADQLRDIVRLLDERGIEADDVGLRRPSLDEVFLAVTGKPLEPTGSDSDHQAESADAA